MKKNIKKNKRRKQGKGRRRFLFSLFSILLLSILLVCGFFRFRFYVVLSGSMEPKLPVGSLVVADTERTDVKIGEIVTFQKSGRTVTHRVTGRKEHGYQTKGDANQEADYDLLQPEQIVGTVVFCIPYLGYGALWVQKYRILIICGGITVLNLLFLFPSEQKERKKVRLNYEGRK